MPQETVKIGLVYPPGGGEYEYYQAAEALGHRLRPYVVCAASSGGDKTHDPEHLERTADIASLAFTASTLTPLRPDSAMWACTSGSFILGRAFAERQAAAIGEAAGCPASSTSLAFAAALEEMGISRVAVVATYPTPAANAFKAFLEEFGRTVTGLAHLDAPSGRHSYLLPPQLVMEKARALDGPEVEAILIPDTAMPGFAIAKALERELDKPVLAANQVTLWQGLKLAQSSLRPPDSGLLLARH